MNEGIFSGLGSGAIMGPIGSFLKPQLKGTTLPITNPGFIEGLSGWTVESGAPAVWTESGVPSGFKYFAGPNASSISSYRINLTDLGVPSTVLDSGTLSVAIGYHAWTYPGDSNYGNVGLRCLTSDRSVIQTYWSANRTADTITWYTDIYVLPVNTRIIEILLKGTRSSGTNCDAYFSTISGSLGFI